MLKKVLSLLLVVVCALVLYMYSLSISAEKHDPRLASHDPRLAFHESRLDRRGQHVSSRNHLDMSENAVNNANSLHKYRQNQPHSVKQDDLERPVLHHQQAAGDQVEHQGEASDDQEETGVKETTPIKKVQMDDKRRFSYGRRRNQPNQHRQQDRQPLDYAAHEAVKTMDLEKQNHRLQTNSDNLLAQKWYNDVQAMNFSVNGPDVIVFLHMQKTGGSFFGKNLVTNLDLNKACECAQLKTTKSRTMARCPCLSDDGKRIWLFSRYSVGWPCGLHADWTELTSCVDGKMTELESGKRHRRYQYITILRDPVKRYLSEWAHVRRGATWSEALLKCNGKSADLRQVPFCYKGESWQGVGLQEFMDCSSNLAHNRQTRMLANLSLIGCYDKRVVPDKKRRDQMMLESAKENLAKMMYIGIMEHSEESQFLFQKTFGINFIQSFAEQAHKVHADVTMDRLADEQIESIKEHNSLDMELYEFGKRLFQARLKMLFHQKHDEMGFL